METSYKNILVAIDGSEPSKAAYLKAIEMTKRHNATLHLVYIVDTSPYHGAQMYDMNFIKKAISRGEKFIGTYESKAKELGIENLVTIVEKGSPRSAIANHAAKKANADIIICGATGLNAVERVFIGGVSDYVVRNAKCDVLIVRHDHKESIQI